ncbi:MAG: hypothetical protein KJS97_07650 [Alphaproteobacteria bacterium]|nr:hypothetical protein [Alphaproteobacteria bacterium]
MERTALALAAAAATAAAAALCVWAAGFALFAFLSPSIGDAAAGAAVAAVAAGALLAAGVYSANKAKEKKEERTVASVVEHNEPMHFVADVVRNRPLIALGVSVVAGLIASRQPGLVREIAGALSSPDSYRRR